MLAYGVGDDLQSLNPSDATPSLLSDMINNALPPPLMKDVKNNELTVSAIDCKINSHEVHTNLFQLKLSLQYFSKVLQNGSAESSESASTSSIGSNNSSHNKAPGSELHQKSINSSLALSNTLNSTVNGSTINSLQSTINSNSNMLSNPFQEFSPEVSKQVCHHLPIEFHYSLCAKFFQILAIENDPSLSPMEKETRKRLCLFGQLCGLILNSLNVSLFYNCLNSI